MSNVYKIHFLKIVQPFLDDILSGQKTFEVRFNDRNFLVGDTILLYEWDNVKQVHSGEALWFKLRYMLNADTVPSLPLGLVVMSVADYVRVHDFTPYDKHGETILALQGEDLRCDQCGSTHMDEREWSLRPHKTHLCDNCGQEFEGSRKAVSNPVFGDEGVSLIVRPGVEELTDWLRSKVCGSCTVRYFLEYHSLESLYSLIEGQAAFLSRPDKTVGECLEFTDECINKFSLLESIKDSMLWDCRLLEL